MLFGLFSTHPNSAWSWRAKMIFICPWLVRYHKIRVAIGHFLQYCLSMIWWCEGNYEINTCLIINKLMLRLTPWWEGLLLHFVITMLLSCTSHHTSKLSNLKKIKPHYDDFIIHCLLQVVSTNIRKNEKETYLQLNILICINNTKNYWIIRGCTIHY